MVRMYVLENGMVYIIRLWPKENLPALLVPEQSQSGSIRGPKAV